MNVELDTVTSVDGVAMSDQGAPARHRRWRPHLLDVVAVGIVVVAFALPLRGLLRYQGPPMEEGFMLAFPQEVLRGSVPNEDFLHLYGPGSLWVLAGAFKAFGTSLATERWFGLLQHAGIVFGVWAVARYWGRRTATVCALVSLVIVVTFVTLIYVYMYRLIKDIDDPFEYASEGQPGVSEVPLFPLTEYLERQEARLGQA